MDTPPPPLLVVCLCAQWCGACREYRALFDQVGAAFGAGTRFVWVDIEDDALLVDGIDVENFPTLMLAQHGRPLFFGTVMPHAETLRRMVETALAGGFAPLTGAPASAPDLLALPGRLAVSD